MAHIYENAYLGGKIVPIKDAQVSVASAAVLYGLSVYTVFPICRTAQGFAAFRLRDHFDRLINSARIIGLDTFEPSWTFERFEGVVKELAAANTFSDDVFVRVTVHAVELVPGTRSRGVATDVSMFIYEAKPIVPQDGARLKTSLWRRVPDNAIPSRAKVNGAYVNSVLAKQDALDSGYDDCVFLDGEGQVCELSAANIFLVRASTLITPDSASDLLEGINRRTVIELALDMGIQVERRRVDLTEMYIADEIFTSGTSAFVAPVVEIDRRRVGNGAMGDMTARLRDAHHAVLHGTKQGYEHLLTAL